MPVYNGIYRLPYAASASPPQYQRAAVVSGGRLYTPYVDNSAATRLLSLRSTTNLQDYTEHGAYQSTTVIKQVAIASDASLAESEKLFRVLFAPDLQYLWHASYGLTQGWEHNRQVSVGGITGFNYASALDGSYLHAIASATHEEVVRYCAYDMEAETWGTRYQLSSDHAYGIVGLAVFSGELLALYHTVPSYSYLRVGRIAGDPPAFTQDWYASANGGRFGALTVTPDLAYCFYNNASWDATNGTQYFDAFERHYDGSSWSAEARIYIGGCMNPSGLWADGVLRVFLPKFAGGAKKGNLQYLYMIANDGSGWSEPGLLFDGGAYDGGGWRIYDPGGGGTFPVSTNGPGWGITFRIYNGSEYRLLLYAEGLGLYEMGGWSSFITSGKSPS